MRTALFSDVHGNLEALEAVLRAGQARGVDAWVCLGDVVGYGADPAACLARVRRLCAVFLQGNHDAAVAGVQDLEYFTPHARRAVEWTRQQLSAGERNLLGLLALTHTRGDAFLVHAEPGNPGAWNYVEDEDDATGALAAVAARLVYVGHSHQAFVCALDDAAPGRCARFVARGCGRVALERATRYLVNVGSVGQPRDGDRRACFALRDDADDSVELVRAEYDIGAAQEKILQADLPRFLADRLGAGC